jgi:hypothetical protein
MLTFHAAGGAPNSPSFHIRWAASQPDNSENVTADGMAVSKLQQVKKR